MADPTSRFSSRVENYVKYRPSYPPALVDLLAAECGLRAGSVVADVGSGTGLLAELFLRYGCRVFGVEPNPEMRAAGERLLAGYASFTSVAGAAEATTLPGGSVDFVTAGQAFHWFDQAAARAEFARILRPRGWAALVWNDRRAATTPFLAAYERLLHRHALDYAAVNHKRIDEAMLGAFFAPGSFTVATFANQQLFDFAGLQGRLLSSSYAPEPGHPRHAPMLAELRAIFEAEQAGGTVAFDYDTKVYYGRLAAQA
jgi:SAM-dependent methyltransferase